VEIRIVRHLKNTSYLLCESDCVQDVTLKTILLTHKSDK